MTKNWMKFFFMGEPTTLQEGDAITRGGHYLTIERRRGDEKFSLRVESKDGHDVLYAPWLEDAHPRDVERFMIFLAGTHGFAIELDWTHMQYILVKSE